MSDLVLVILFWVGVVMLGAFIVAGLLSPKARAMLQRPAEDMVRRDRQQWDKPGAEDEGDQR